jgi:hypothetical protein
LPGGVCAFSLPDGVCAAARNRQGAFRVHEPPRGPAILLVRAASRIVSFRP